MVTLEAKGRRYPEIGDTARDGGRVDLSTRAPGRGGNAGSRPAKGGRGQARREVGWWCVTLMVAAVLLSSSGTRVFGANLPPPADLACFFTQLTHSTGPLLGSFFPSINATGTRIAFSSNADLTGDNAAGNVEIFLVDTTTGSLTQLTHSPTPGGNFIPGPSINAAGTRIAFGSNADLTGNNADGNREIFLADTTTGSLTQLTHSFGIPGFCCQSFSSSINAAGTRIALSSNADLTGDNADASEEIFLADTTTGSLTQLTHSLPSVLNEQPSINATGTRIAFSNTVGNGNIEIFLADTTTGSLTQLTHSPTFGGAIPGPSINAAGTRIAFNSSADLTGDNAAGNTEIFLVDTTTGSLIQLTHSPGGGSSGASINATGTRIAFNSNADLIGGNTGGESEIFLATCLGIVNDLVTFTPLPSTFQTTADTLGCPTGFAGKFSFAARLTAKPSSPALADLRVQVQTLTNGNLLQNADSGPGGAGATLTVPQTGALADGILRAQESVDVPFVLCLQQLSPFRFFVDVLGDSQ